MVTQPLLSSTVSHGSSARQPQLQLQTRFGHMQTSLRVAQERYQRRAAAACYPLTQARRAVQLVRCGESQGSPSVTKKRTTGPPFLPPITPNEGGGGGGGGWGNITRNVAINAMLLGLYFVFDSGGGDGGFFGGGGGGGGGGSGPGGPENIRPNRPEITCRDLDSEDEEEEERMRPAGKRWRKRVRAKPAV